MDKSLYSMSRFNILFKNKDHYFIYNSLYGGLYEIDEKTYNICSASQIDAEQIRHIPNEMINKLHQKSFIVANDSDVENIELLRYFKLAQSFQKDRLTLIIAPTLYCNFSCPYCYEKDLPYTYMQEKVIGGLIQFIKNQEKNFKYLEICWYGGEPLCAIEVIKEILTRISREISLPIKRHTMVSNGYLINTKFVELFTKYKLDYLQITIDGEEENHNKNRLSKNGQPTFSKIINNVDYVIKAIPKMNIGIRMNVHKDNMEDFVPLYKKLTNLWACNRVHIYPAFVLDNNACKVPCFNSIEKTNYLHKLYKQIGLKLSITNLELKLGKCTAIFEHSYIIDPQGDLYKCWVDVGIKAFSIGSVFDGITNHRIVAKYLLSSDKFSDKKCLKCSIFPICSGGCNKYRIDKNYKTQDICPLSPDIIIKFLKEKIEK